MTSGSNRSSNLLFAAVTIGIIISAFLLTNALPIIPASPNGLDDSAIEDNSGGNRSGMSLSAEGPHELDYTPVFEIYGVTFTSYIRGGVGEIYQNGGWSPAPNSPITTYLDPKRTVTLGFNADISPYSSKTQSQVTINPLPTFYGSIPALVYTNYIQYLSVPASYYSDLQVFSIDGSYSSTYDITSTHYSFSANLLRDKLVSQTASLNTQVPVSLKSCLSYILGHVDFSHASSAYDRIIAIQSYLRSNYVYDLNYRNAPSNVDPIEWFLLTEKRGVCANFNSAFAMLLRESGIPARVVGGYLIEGSTDYQVVRAYKAHLWAEVKFENVGWVEFDATGAGFLPPPTPIETKTEINSLSPSAIKGGQFLTAGKVTDLAGNPISGLSVKIYLKTDKTSPQGLACGSGTTLTDGTFSITSNIPISFSVGNYQVVAQNIGNAFYKGSQSDPTLAVNSLTEIKPIFVNEAIIGKSFNLLAQLTEKTTLLPIPNQTLKLIYIENGQEKQILAQTNQSGHANFVFSSIPKTSDNKLNYKLSFEENEFYLATEFFDQLNFISTGENPSDKPTQNVDTPSAASFFSSPLFIVLIAASSLISISIIVIFLRKRKKTLTISPQIISSPIPIQTATDQSSDSAIAINFPQIKPPFPDVWGINELISARILLTKNGQPWSGDIDVKIGNESAKKVRTNTDGVVLVDFKVPTKGTINVAAKCMEGANPPIESRVLKVVDYTEEIVAIFKDVFDIGKGKGIRVNKDTSPREFQRLLLTASNQQSDLSLENFVTIFEVADYSLRSLDRSDYEEMFLASLSIKQQLSVNTRYDG